MNKRFNRSAHQGETAFDRFSLFAKKAFLSTLNVPQAVRDSLSGIFHAMNWLRVES